MTASARDSAETRDSAVHAVFVGLRSAWRTPSIIASALAEQLSHPGPGPTRSPAGASVDVAVRVAHRALRLLARVRPSRWRATCLYRSVAECLTLRALGFPARVVIGVGNGAAPAETIAHACVECDGVRCRSTRGAAELEALAATRG